jgi:nickel-type superoxide dismutase maturation protease
MKGPPRPVATTVLLVLALVLVRPRRVVVDGPSMEPTLCSGDRLVVVRRLRLRLGDVVAVRDPGHGSRMLVKRVVARSGDEVVVAGDNPDRSTDSRSFGPVGRRAVVGRVVYRYGPPGRRGPLLRRTGPGKMVGTPTRGPGGGEVRFPP